MVHQPCKKTIERFWGECMNLYKLTKDELVARCERLQSENERLQDEINNLNDYYVEMENQYADVINTLDSMDCIKDVDWFKFKMEIYGLMTPQLEDFIETYLKYYNERR